MESEIHLKGVNARSESIARMVTGGGTITNRTTLVGEGRDTKGFLGCNGLKLSDEGEILSVPALRARSAQAQLSHEASIGMIDQAKLSYLMASGMSEDAARDLKIGRAHVRTPVNNAHLVCRLLSEKKQYVTNKHTKAR